MAADGASLMFIEEEQQLGFKVRTVPLDAPWTWLAKGWRDLCAMPFASLGYGAVFCAVGWLTFAVLSQHEVSSLIVVLAGGFMLVAPLLGAGFYEMSRLRENGERVTFRSVVDGCAGAVGRLAMFGIVLYFAYFLWVELSFLLFTVFLGGTEVPEASTFFQQLIFTNAGLGLLFAAVLTGAVLAGLVFCLSSVAAPLLLLKDVDLVTAIATSIRAVHANRGPMLLWAAIIAGHMALGLTTLFVGLLVIFPLLGHATWHAFRDLVDVD